MDYLQKLENSDSTKLKYFSKDGFDQLIDNLKKNDTIKKIKWFYKGVEDENVKSLVEVLLVDTNINFRKCDYRADPFVLLKLRKNRKTCSDFFHRVYNWLANRSVQSEVVKLQLESGQIDLCEKLKVVKWGTPLFKRVSSPKKVSP